MNDIYRINEKDNVAVALRDLKKGESLGNIILKNDVPFGHKLLLCDLKAGDDVVKYGCSIGKAARDISAGEYVHTHNLSSALCDKLSYAAPCEFKAYSPQSSGLTFSGFERENGAVGIRNDVWIIPTVGCVGMLCERIAAAASKKLKAKTGKIKVISHPYGCSQLGGDLEYTARTLAALAEHPNAGGVLLVSLGCENNDFSYFKQFLKNPKSKRLRFLTAQNETDELSAGERLVCELYEAIKAEKRAPFDLSRLCIGLKCGGSDAFSGITANALCGLAADKLSSLGASFLLSETPEMFGAEHILMSRAVSREVFGDIGKMVNSFKEYYISHNQPVNENPSPGNRAGGITTLEEKSLGCVQKGGFVPVTGVLKTGERACGGGLSLVASPGNDMVSSTCLAACGAQLILFTTGRGTPFGSVVPTVKISSNSALAKRKPGWIDLDAGRMLGGSAKELLNELAALILEVASGRKTKNEINGFYDAAIWKNGVTL